MSRGTSRHLALRGVAAAVFGIFALSSAGLTLAQMTLTFGLYALSDGLITLLLAPSAAKTASRWARRAQGAVGATLAFVALLLPPERVSVLPYLVGVWALVAGAFEVVCALELRRGWPGESLGISAGGIMLCLGVATIAWPGVTAPALIFLLGSYGALFGTALVLLSYRLHRRHLRRQRARRREARFY